MTVGTSLSDTSAAAATQGTWVLAAAILGSSMAFIDGTVVNVALPALQASLHADGSALQWVVEAYALFLAALLLVGGSLGDRFGRKRCFLAGVLLFAAASGACGAAGTIHQLVAARAVQGIGAALLVPGSLALISASFPAETRGAAIGTWSGFTAITAAIGPLLGGWLVQHASWRWVFLLNLPLALAVMLITVFRVGETTLAASSEPLDWPGALAATAGLGTLTFALIEAAALGHAALPLALLGLLLLGAFVFIEAHSTSPMLPLRLFRSRNFTGANLMTLFLYAPLGGLLYFLPLNLIQIQGYSPSAAGAALLPLILLLFLLSRWSGGLVARFGERLPLVLGPLLAAPGFALFAAIGHGGSYWTHVLPAIFVLGCGLAVSVAPLTTVVMNSVPQASAGSASGVNNAVSRVASLLAVAVFGLLFNAAFSRSLHRALDHSSLTPPARQAIFASRADLGAIPTPTTEGRRAVELAFVSSFNRIAFLAAALSVVAALLAATTLERSAPTPGSRHAG